MIKKNKRITLKIIKDKEVMMRVNLLSYFKQIKYVYILFIISLINLRIKNIPLIKVTYCLSITKINRQFFKSDSS